MIETTKEVRAVLDAVEAFTAQGRLEDVRAFAELMYEDDVLLIGEGDAAVTRGVDQLIPKIVSAVGEWGERARLKFRMAEPVVATESIFSTMLDAECHPEKPEAEIIRYRLLAVWRRGPRGWRIAQEMFTSGSL